MFIQKKITDFFPVDKMPGEPTKGQEKAGRRVRLTEDLLFMVNKQLKAMDKRSRDEKINSFTRQPHPSNRPFTEVIYRKKSTQDISETERAVMHKAIFNSTSIAVCEYESMVNFLFDNSL